MARSDSFSTGRFRGRGEMPKFFNRTETNPIGLAQGPVDGASLCDSHFGAADQGRSVRRIGISVTNETLRRGALEDSCLEDPATGSDIRKTFLKDRLDPTTTSPGSKLQEPGVGHIPSTLQELQIARSY
jgi:hypothetical protein